MLLARDAGVDTPRVVVAGTSGSLALLVVEEVAGTELYELDGGDGDRRSARRRVDASCARSTRRASPTASSTPRHVLVDGAGSTGPVRVVGFDFASSSARFRQTAGDVAQLLAATTAVVGARTRGRRRGADHGQGDGGRRAPGAPARRAVGVDPRRARRARPARRPPRRAPHRRSRGDRAPTPRSCAGSTACSPAAC